MDTIDISGLAGRFAPGHGMTGGASARGAAVVVSGNPSAAASAGHDFVSLSAQAAGLSSGAVAASPADAAAQAADQADSDDAEALAELMRQRNLSFSIDEDSGVSVVRVIDSESGDVIRQMPSEAWVKMARQISEFASGLVSEKA